ncbi:MAG TPA: ABC transporter ATP-binding protein [Aquihabitans sp.]|nr:ABC transporter ATP-binding protein [Aquihabitans sp.]
MAIQGAQPALDLREVGVRFGGIAALDGVSLQVAPGEICGLIGANGAGKTTLFDVISGVRIPGSGRVRLHGRDVTRWSPHRRAREGLRRTFQRVQVFGWLTVEENLVVASEWRGGGGGVLADLVGSPTRRRREVRRRERAEVVIDRCGLAAVRHVQASSLPIGMARLVELGRALVDEPDVLLLDEPASGLDASEAARFAGLVHAARDELGTAVLLVEHDVAFVMEHCDRVVVLHLGRVIADGPPAEVRADPAVRDAYLGTVPA